MKKAASEGDYVKHKTITWMNRGKPFRVIKIENGKAVENWVQMNMVGLMQQIGMMPQPA